MADILKLLAIAAKGDRLAYFERKFRIGLAIQNIHRQTSPDLSCIPRGNSSGCLYESPRTDWMSP